MCLGDQKLRHIKCMLRARIKGAVKKDNKRIRNDRTRLLQKVRAFHKRYFYFGIFIESEPSVFEPLAVTVTTTSGDYPGAHSKEKTTSKYTLLRLSAPDFRQRRELGRPRPVRDWWKKFASPEGAKLVVARRNHIKMTIHKETGS